MILRHIRYDAPAERAQATRDAGARLKTTARSQTQVDLKTLLSFSVAAPSRPRGTASSTPFEHAATGAAKVVPGPKENGARSRLLRNGVGPRRSKGAGAPQRKLLRPFRISQHAWAPVGYRAEESLQR